MSNSELLAGMEELKHKDQVDLEETPLIELFSSRLRTWPFKFLPQAPAPAVVTQIAADDDNQS